jgi:phosphoglycolate phosphatase-like HAD superfamily hydrolase
MNRLKVALFDVDGVLLDSLALHLKISEDKNREYELGLKIPNAAEFKQMARRGVRISPMKFFFKAVGFSEEFAKKADQQYQQVFMQNYSPAPFPETHSMLSALRQTLELGIVTSNVKQNVIDALGPNMAFFNPLCLYTKDNHGLPKSQAILSAMAALQAFPSETVYIGDQLSDWEAAKKAGINFLGVAYGWGISEEDKAFPVAKDPSDVVRHLLNWTAFSQNTAVNHFPSGWPTQA